MKQIEKLTPVQQEQVLDFAQELFGELPAGISGKELLEFVDLFPPEDLEKIKQVIEEGWEQINE